MRKFIIMFGMFLGSIVGGYVPIVFFGAGALSVSVILLSAVGAIGGVYLAWKFTKI